MDIRFEPLTNKQKARLDAKSERIWTESELDIMKGNLHYRDIMRTVMTGRCRNCGFVLEADADKVAALPGIGNVCNICWLMYNALKSPGLRDAHYFTRLHQEWIKFRDDRGDKGGWRDRAGL